MEKLEIVREKKQQHQEKLVQKNITEAFNKLPETAKKRMLEEEEKEKRLELKEAKENIWKRWRGKKDVKKDKRLENRTSRKDLM